MSKKGHYQGSKHRGSHTTVIPLAETVVKAAEKLPQVTGIAPGFIDQHAKSNKPRIQYKEIPAGLEVKALGSSSKQTLILYTSSPKLTQEALMKQLT